MSTPDQLVATIVHQAVQLRNYAEAVGMLQAQVQEKSQAIDTLVKDRDRMMKEHEAEVLDLTATILAQGGVHADSEGGETA